MYFFFSLPILLFFFTSNLSCEPCCYPTCQVSRFNLLFLGGRRFCHICTSKSGNSSIHSFVSLKTSLRSRINTFIVCCGTMLFVCCSTYGVPSFRNIFFFTYLFYVSRCYPHVLHSAPRTTSQTDVGTVLPLPLNMMPESR